MLIATGQVQKIQTMMDGSVRVVVDIPKEVAPHDMLRWQFETVRIEAGPVVATVSASSIALRPLVEGL